MVPRLWIKVKSFAILNSLDKISIAFVDLLQIYFFSSSVSYKGSNFMEGNAKEQKLKTRRDGGRKERKGVD